MTETTARPVFVLGDSRTGTMTLHKFFQSAGFNSVHYFFKESGVTEPAHVDYASNWDRLRAFIDGSGYTAFTDYPTRTFYRDLFATYPDARFILTTRRDVATWQRSMREFFSKFDIKIDLDKLTVAHTEINEGIRTLAAETGAPFLEICIDDDAGANGQAVSRLLGLDTPMALGHENRTAAYDRRLWSSRLSLYNTNEPDFLAYVKRLTQSSKAMLSEHGWVYLINDSSDFLDYCYGARTWSQAACDNARAALQTRHDTLAAQGITYLKFAVPEKQIVYPQFLPKIFDGKDVSDQRPARLLQDMDLPCFDYPRDVLTDARSHGHVYFRGDSHTNWLGAWFLYHHVVETLNRRLGQAARTRAPIRLAELEPSLASYGGDLFTQLDPEARQHFDGPWKDVALGDKIEYLTRYQLPDGAAKAVRQPVDQGLLDLLGERETFRFSNPDTRLPRAVIFRDSTSDFMVDLLAEHFSESLFIWHKGQVYEDVIAQEKPDVVLHIMAERFLVQYEKTAPFATLGLG
ncbi:sulfotransferase [Marinibacterium sp. SX1]|uniref:sulfotransferase n=1 Tax=Marinibacterium sp. SX1 TaxID=3388424 RepID=UPI003D17AC5B